MSKDIWLQLSEAGIVEGDKPTSAIVESPWYVKILLAFSGWLAALFLLGFVGMAFEAVFRDAGTALLVGLIMIAGAFALLRSPKNEFIEHLALAISLAGQALVIYAIFDSSQYDGVMLWLKIVLLQAPLAVVMPNYAHRVFSSYVTAISISMMMFISGWQYAASGVVMLIAALCWMNEFRYPKYMRLVRSTGYGVVMALIHITGTLLIGHSTLFGNNRSEAMDIGITPWIGEAVSGLVMLYIVWTLLQRYGKNISDRVSILAILGTVILSVVSMDAHGVTVGMMILVLGFAGSNRILMGLGILSLLGFISYYYYSLETTLLEKSLTLLAVGVFLLVGRFLALRFMMENREGEHV